ncbi:helix-turn-helix domain-containing protein [Paraburkholderia phytofirmans]|uniref:Transcriptional regulator, AraC family n=1 Tax=Paraburkholderia phytofirmans (strain DSM 17436 / LMG 22146 / PsJN) TaxID=398527 RepID=B2T1H0_PARPJ|nr:AraC family transcriptional regulator [Paraburkholderia phytofirmans]ACD15527.1 transcriptional regulator, AraC family [Paraburkholderia phytofirmans PsJN]
MNPDMFACEPGFRKSEHPTNSLEEEADWRKSAHIQFSASRISIAFWRDIAEHERQLSAPVLEDCYIIEVLLRNTIVDCFRNGKRITKGTGGFGGTQIAGPGEEIRCNFKRPVEAVHVFVPRATLVATYEELQQCKCPADYHLSDPGFAPDTVMGKLGCTLLDATSLRSPFSGLYCESLGMAILARAMEFQNRFLDDGLRQGLAPWRLKRTIEYIEDNLGEQISLTDLAQRAGLSRMHFAAQFKLATGLSPHAYLTEKRLGAAKSLLAEGRLPIAQIAYAVGFHTQAHFTTVFRQATGLTPKRWREQASGATR